MNIINNGFSLYEDENHELDIALLSLRIGLSAYFSTYKKVMRFFVYLDPPSGDDSEFTRNRIRNSGYVQDYFETVFHLHHFIEISIKEILRQKHELLASKADRKTVILDKLLQGEEITAKDRESLYSLDFGDARERLKTLIAGERIQDYRRMEFIKENDAFLRALNTLRNRLAHRGTFVLNYKALDELFGKHILSFIKQLLDLRIYENIDFNWQPKALHCRVDPIQEIINEWKNPSPNYKTIAILKQLALAAYANPLRLESPHTGMKFREGESTKEMREKQAKKELDNPNVEALDIKICPVCGAESLVRYYNAYSDHSGNPEDTEWYIDSLYCHCCKLDIDAQLSDINISNFNMDKYWRLPSKKNDKN